MYASQYITHNMCFYLHNDYFRSFLPTLTLLGTAQDPAQGRGLPKARQSATGQRVRACAIVFPSFTPPLHQPFRLFTPPHPPFIARVQFSRYLRSILVGNQSSQPWIMKMMPIDLPFYSWPLYFIQVITYDFKSPLSYI